MNIIVTMRSNDYYVCLESRPDVWGAGKTINEAIGNLVRENPNVFNIKITYS